MARITVCVGTSCHISGSHHVIDRLGQLIRQYELEDQVELAGAFCMGNCGENVSAEIDGKVIEDLNKDSVDRVFEREILAKL